MSKKKDLLEEIETLKEINSQRLKEIEELNQRIDVRYQLTKDGKYGKYYFVRGKAKKWNDLSGVNTSIW